MKNKKIILSLFVMVVFLLFIFFVYISQKDKPIIESKQITKNIEKKDTIKFSDNIVKLGFQKENIPGFKS